MIFTDFPSTFHSLFFNKSVRVHDAYEEFKSNSELKKYYRAGWESHRSKEDEFRDARQHGIKERLEQAMAVSYGVFRHLR